ncbi:MAG: sugar phosphate nucleotidyltransferase [bacterium]
MKPTLVILAAGMGSRYGGLKQVDPVGPSGETIMDYSIFDAVRAGFTRVVFVIRSDFEEIFKHTIGAKYRNLVDVDYAYQSIDDLPIGYSVPSDRSKPWGTAHAIYAARDVVKAPFAAINADDFYGQDAFRTLAEFLSREEASSGSHFAMVGYLLEQTLSENGSVARGVCKIRKNGLLETVTEMTKVVRVPGGVENQEKFDEPVKLTGQERVSMNMWGFTPQLFDALAERFPQWLEMNAQNSKAEWYIPFVVDELVKEGQADVVVLPTESSWFGVTYREDKPRVVEAIQKLVNTGVYPSQLLG